MLAVLGLTMALALGVFLSARETPSRPKTSWPRSQPRSCTRRARQPRPGTTSNRHTSSTDQSLPEKSQGPDATRPPTSGLRFYCRAMHVKHGEKLRDQGDDTGALTEFMRALEIDPSNELAAAGNQGDAGQGRRQRPQPGDFGEPGAGSQLSEIGSPVELKPISNEPLTLHSGRRQQGHLPDGGQGRRASTSSSIRTTPQSASRWT